MLGWDGNCRGCPLTPLLQDHPSCSSAALSLTRRGGGGGTSHAHLKPTTVRSHCAQSLCDDSVTMFRELRLATGNPCLLAQVCVCWSIHSSVPALACFCPPQLPFSSWLGFGQQSERRVFSFRGDRSHIFLENHPGFYSVGRQGWILKSRAEDKRPYLMALKPKSLLINIRISQEFSAQTTVNED